MPRITPVYIEVTLGGRPILAGVLGIAFKLRGTPFIFLSVPFSFCLLGLGLLGIKNCVLLHLGVLILLDLVAVAPPLQTLELSVAEAAPSILFVCVSQVIKLVLLIPKE